MAKHDKKKMIKKMNYDKEQDIFALHKGFSADEKFKGNIDIGDLILDVSTKGRIRGIEILNASTFLKDLKIKEGVLQNLKDADFNASISPNNMVISLFLRAGEKEIPARIAVPLETVRI